MVRLLSISNSRNVYDDWQTLVFQALVSSVPAPGQAPSRECHARAAVASWTGGQAALAGTPERRRRICAVPFTLRNIKKDLHDVASKFDGAPDLEFRAATRALELEQPGLS